MKHITIDYGIDLGTTNSAICRMDHGTPTIIRSDTGMETMPSCISFKKGGVMRVGQSAYDELGRDKLRALKRRQAAGASSCIEFKRYMGSDTRFSVANTDHGLTPEELSAKVIGALCSFVTDEEVEAAVITVPAKFTANQKDATLRAARMAGISQVELLQEPIAASMAYGLKADDRNGIWMVFDLGGGTLDVALVNVSDGVMQVYDTEGDNYLGGKNLDEAIVSRIIMPELTSRYAINLADEQVRALWFEALKVEAERLKNKLSYTDSDALILEAGDWGEDADGEEIELNLTIPRQRIEGVMRPVLQKAVDVCNTLMERNHLTSDQLSHLILIGGPTYIPLLRQMLREQVTPNVETGIDPMTAVAVGAAIYASTIPVKSSPSGDDSVLQLEVDFESTTVDSVAFVPVRAVAPVAGLTVRAIRRSDGWESAPDAVGPDGALLELDLQPGIANVFRIEAQVDGQPCKCHPAELTIIQGLKAGAAILPYNIGMEVYNPTKKKYVFVAFSGLEKNRTLPAKGAVYGLKTMSPLHPAVASDSLRIAIYQGDDSAEGKSASLFEYVSDVRITGEDIASFIPEGSLLDIFINVDRSEMMTIKAVFSQTDQTVEKQLDASLRHVERDTKDLDEMAEKARQQIRDLAAELPDSPQLTKLFDRLRLASDDLHSGAQHKQVEQHIKEVLRQVEEIDEGSEWQKAFNKLKRALHDLQMEAIGRTEPDISETLDSFKKQVQVVEKFQDINRANDLRQQIQRYIDLLHRDESFRNFIKWVYNDFKFLCWRDPIEAKRLVEKAMKILADEPNAPASKTSDISWQIDALLIRNTQPHVSTTTRGPLDIPSM